MVRSRIRPRALVTIASVATAVLSSLPAHAATRTARWTGAAGNNLWADPLNWDGGVVPDADTDVWASNATIDLGGVLHPRAAASFNDGGGMESTTRIVNGTLRTPTVNGGGQIDIASNVTAPAGTTLNLIGSVNVPGRIVGPIDVVFATNTQITTTQTYSGNTIVSGRVMLSGVSGRLESTPVVEVRGSLDLNNSSGLAASEVRLAGGKLTSFLDTTVGDLSLAAGESNIEVGLNTIQSYSLRHDPGGLLQFAASRFGTNFGRIELAQLPATSGDNASPTRRPIVAWARSYNSFVARDGNALRPLDTATEYAASLAEGENVRLTTATATAPASVAPNSLILYGAALTLGDAAKLTIASGGLMFDPRANGAARVPSAITGGGSIDLGAEGIIYAFRNLSDPQPEVVHTIDVPVTAGSMTVRGDGTVALNRANTLSGGLAVRGGNVRVALPAALGTGPVTLGAGKLSITAIDATIPNPILTGSSALVAPATGLTTLTGTLGGTLTGSGDGLLGSNGSMQLLGAFRLAGSNATTAAEDLLLYLNGGTTLIDGTYDNPGTTLYCDASSRNNVIGGNGRFAGRVFPDAVNYALVSPGPLGNAPGRLTLGQAFFRHATLHVDLAGTTPGDGYDQLVLLTALSIDGAPTYGSVLEVAVAPGFVPALGDVFTIIDNRFTGPVLGTFGKSNLPEGALLTTGNTTFRISYTGGDGNDVTLTTVVPEPSATIFLAACTFALLPRRQRKLPG